VVSGMLPMLPCAVGKGAIRQWAGLGRDQSFCAVMMCRDLSRQPDPFSVVTSHPCKDPASTAVRRARSEGGGQRQLPIGTRRVADGERKAGLGTP
jgi:hypothetical protein